MRLNRTSSLRRQIHYAGCAVLFAVISWALLSANPFAAFRNTPLTHLKTVSDIVLHMGVYTVLSTACFSLIGSNGDPGVRRTVLMLLLVHAIGTECLQQWMPNRVSDPLDAAANLSGIATGALLSMWIIRVRSESRA